MSGTLESLALDTISFTLVVRHSRPKRMEHIKVYADERHGVFLLSELRRSHQDRTHTFETGKETPLDCHTWKEACAALADRLQALLDELDYYEDTLFGVLQERYRKSRGGVAG